MPDHGHAAGDAQADGVQRPKPRAEQLTDGLRKRERGGLTGAQGPGAALALQDPSGFLQEGDHSIEDIFEVPRPPASTDEIGVPAGVN